MNDCKYTYRSDPSAGLTATVSGDVVYCTTHHKYGGCQSVVAEVDYAARAKELLDALIRIETDSECSFARGVAREVIYKTVSPWPKSEA